MMDTAAILRADADRPKFDPRKYGKKSIKPLQLSEFEEKNLTANAVVMMMLDMSAGTQKKLKAIQRERQACEAEILSVRSERHKLAVRRMGLRKFKRKKARRGRGVAGSAKLPPILAKALEPPMGPMALQKLAGVYLQAQLEFLRSNYSKALNYLNGANTIAVRARAAARGPRIATT